MIKDRSDNKTCHQLHRLSGVSDFPVITCWVHWRLLLHSSVMHLRELQISLTLMNFCISLAHREGKGCKGMCRGEVLINALRIRGEEKWWSLIQRTWGSDWDELGHLEDVLNCDNLYFFLPSSVFFSLWQCTPQCCLVALPQVTSWAVVLTPFLRELWDTLCEP